MFNMGQVYRPAHKELILKRGRIHTQRPYAVFFIFIPIPSKNDSVLAHSSAPRVGSSDASDDVTTFPTGIKYEPLYSSTFSMILGDPAANAEVYAPSSGEVRRYFMIGVAMNRRPYGSLLAYLQNNQCM